MEGRTAPPRDRNAQVTCADNGPDDLPWREWTPWPSSARTLGPSLGLAIAFAAWQAAQA
jgi:hypothetical protein